MSDSVSCIDAYTEKTRSNISCQQTPDRRDIDVHLDHMLEKSEKIAHTTDRHYSSNNLHSNNKHTNLMHTLSNNDAE